MSINSKGSIGLVILLSFLLLPAYSATPLKAGSACSKQGVTKTYQGKKFTCVKSGRKLVWSKGVVVKKASSTPSPTPFNSPTPTPIPTPTPTPTPSPTPSPTATPTPTPSPTVKDNQRKSAIGIETSKSLNLVQSCKLKTRLISDVEMRPWFKEVKLGFPKAENRLRSFGVIKAITIYVSFNDVFPSGDPIEESKSMIQEFTNFLEETSYGKVSIEFTVPNKYFKINKNSSVYQMNTWNSGNPRQYLDDGIAAADPEINFSLFDLVIVIPPADITEIVYGPAFPESGNFAITVDGARITSSTVAGSDSRNIKVRQGLPWVWLAHEIGHLFGLAHPYLNLVGPAPYWDLMFWNVGGPGYYGWNRFVLGWIEDDRIFCGSKNSEFRTVLAPISSRSALPNLIVIPESLHKAIVIENRRSTPFDLLNKDEEGIIVYEVFLEQPNEEIRLFPTGKKINGHETGIIRSGESIVINGLTVKNLGGYIEGDLVSVSP